MTADERPLVALSLTPIWLWLILQAPLTKPVPCRGMLSFWRIDGELRKRLP